MQYKDFDIYRRWFNSQFSLSFNGKFCGLRRLGDKLELFAYRLYKLLNRRDKHAVPLGDVLVIRFGGNVCKLYSR